MILGGAALAGMAQRIAPQVTVPVIDSVHAGARVAAALAADHAARAKPVREHLATPTFGIGDALTRLLA